MSNYENQLRRVVLVCLEDTVGLKTYRRIRSIVALLYPEEALVNIDGALLSCVAAICKNADLTKASRLYIEDKYLPIMYNEEQQSALRRVYEIATYFIDSDDQSMPIHEGAYRKCQIA